MELTLAQLAKLNDTVSRYTDIFVDMDNLPEYTCARKKFTKILNAKVKVDLTVDELIVMQDVLDVELDNGNGSRKLNAVDANELYKEVNNAIIAERRRK